MYSQTNFSDFNPRMIPYQSEVIDLLDEWDYSTGTPEILLSGSYGSAKSILMAHIVVRHCLENKGARVCLARKAMPDLKDTIFKEVLEHIADDFIEGEHYWVNNSSAKITWFNGSEILSRSWSDKKYKKGRSLKLSMVVFEELTENNDDDKEAFDTLKARLRRIPEVKENILIAATNPAGPQHWAYKYFIESEKKTRKVFYSVTTDNPFLDPVYIQQLKQDLDPKSARRYIYGEWIEINEERVYYAYDTSTQFKKTTPYEPNLEHPILVCFDFNIGEGKPMSSCLMQYIKGEFHIYNQAVIEGARTLDVCEDYMLKGLLPRQARFIIHGDATGKSRSTSSIHSDYDLIEKFFANHNLRFEMQVPQSNPPIRTRHNILNSHCKNEAGSTRLWVYKDAPTVDEALRLTRLKKGADYIEDDGPSQKFQHIGTALGYGLVYQVNDSGFRPGSSQRRF